MTAPNKYGRRHNHDAPGNRDHIVIEGNQTTWRTSRDMATQVRVHTEVVVARRTSTGVIGIAIG